MNTLDIKSKLMLLMHRVISLWPEPKVSKELQMEYLKEFRSKSVLMQIMIMSLIYVLSVVIPFIFAIVIMFSFIYLLTMLPVVFIPLLPILIIIGFFAMVSKLDLDSMDIDINHYERWGKDK